MKYKFYSTWNKNIASSITSGLGVLMDIVTRGNGYVQQEVTTDPNLEGVIHSQIENFTFKLDPTLRIAATLGSDTVNGLMKKYKAHQNDTLPQDNPILVRQNAQINSTAQQSTNPPP